MKQRIMTGALAAILSVGSLCLGIAQPAQASHSKAREKAWRYSTYAGTAGTAAALATGHGTWGLIGAGATLLSYTQWKKEVNRRHEHASKARYAAYRRSWYKRHAKR